MVPRNGEIVLYGNRLGKIAPGGCVTVSVLVLLYGTLIYNTSINLLIVKIRLESTREEIAESYPRDNDEGTHIR